MEIVGWEYRHSKHIYKLGERDVGGVLSQSILLPQDNVKGSETYFYLSIIAFSLTETCVNLSSSLSLYDRHMVLCEFAPSYC